VSAAVVKLGTTEGAPRELDALALDRARRGDEGACRALVEAYERPVFALLGRMLGHRARAETVEDLAQETFLRVFRELRRFEPGGSARLSTWILTIATRLAIDELRRRSRAPEVVELSDAVAAPAAKVEATAEERLLGLAVARAAEALAPEHRAVFVLRAYHDLDYDEIAEVTGCEVGTVKSRLARARERLREALGDLHDR
jgi:RNA polymerase sigma-70 factor (ECF subfamily)